ncbi:MAG: glutamate-5-semialdehyde dehydrogenase [Actinomycetaceae bacterium]|nr:glutamate-5-semialdehyde dehydrogenase [Actinomycetaceae bacterium]
MVDENVRIGVHDVVVSAQKAALFLRKTSTFNKNNALHAIADFLLDGADKIVQANARDMEVGRSKGMKESLLDRLYLDVSRISDIADAVRHVASLADPVGEVVEGRRLENGMRLENIRVPMGVIGMIYEARPNVTVDAATLALKAGSAAVLRGGSAAIETNKVLLSLMRAALESVDFPANCITSVDEWGREGGVALMQERGYVDLVIPRGGSGLIQEVVRSSLVPVIETGVGNCHVYIDSSANLDDALNIAINSKTHRLGVCNAAETILVHGDVASACVPQLVHELQNKDIHVHACKKSIALCQPHTLLSDATEEDWETEYLGPHVALKIVDTEDEAIKHISRYSTGHTEAIVARDAEHIQNFIDSVDSAAVIVNASTRFTDGGQFGLGAEIGISTQKLHARGPMGLKEITSTKWIVTGDGHVRA